jgi:hypothetical protein
LLLIRYLWALPNTLIGLLLVPTAMLPRGRMQVIDGVLEAHGPVISAVLRHGAPIPNGASAITFGHVVLARDSSSLEATRAHERVHVRQCEIWGPAFIPAYLMAGLWGLITGTGAYTGNYFERQANLSAAGERENDNHDYRHDQNTTGGEGYCHNHSCHGGSDARSRDGRPGRGRGVVVS